MTTLPPVTADGTQSYDAAEIRDLHLTSGESKDGGEIAQESSASA